MKGWKTSIVTMRAELAATNVLLDEMLISLRKYKEVSREGSKPEGPRRGRAKRGRGTRLGSREPDPKVTRSKKKT